MYVYRLCSLILALGLLSGACGSAELDSVPWDVAAVEAAMERHGVPGLSVAVMEDYELAWTGAYGVMGAGGEARVSESTLFQTASIGKSVTAMAALRQVMRGAVELDADVTGYLTSWNIPENEFAAPVTIRGLLSHTAGVTVHGFVGYRRGTPYPTLLQTLNGELPANNPAIRVDREPGTGFRYSGGGYQILQQVLDDATGTQFAELVATTVFDPLGMETSIYDPLPESEWPRAAIGHRADGRAVLGEWHTYPEHAAGSFWTTPADFARFGIEVMLAFTGQSDWLITQDLAAEMLTPVDAGYGLGLAVADDGGDRLHATHEGGNEGYKTMLVLYPERGQGAVIMTNSDNGLGLAEELVDSLSRHYGWVTGIVLSRGQTIVLITACAMLAVAVAYLWRRRLRS